jgi:TonB family protein
MGDLRPTEEQLENVVGAGTTDYLKDVDEGAETLVNTKRWKYASFFNRVKRAVAQNWHPDVAYRLRDPSGQIYGTKSRLTVLKVSLRPDGTLRDVLIEKPCGVDFLDDEAVKAFREAQPFPNPPAGLVDAQSQLITFKFGFYFEISESSSWKVFRYSN